MDLNNKVTAPQGAGELLQKEIFLEQLERERENVDKERRPIPPPEEKKRRRKEVKKISDESHFGGY